VSPDPSARGNSAPVRRGRLGAALAAALALSPLFLPACGSKTGAEKPRGNVLELSAGAQHACATFDDGELRCWGDNRYGQIGQVPRTAIQGQAQTAEHDSLPAPQIVVGLPASSGVVAGITQTCVFTTDRSLACWGGVDWARPASSALRYNGGASYVTPLALTIAQLSGVDQVSFGVRHLCALVPDGQVVCWGDNSTGQLGVNSTDQYPTDQPTAVPGLPPAVQVAAGTFASCAILQDATVQCWGNDWSGQGSSLVPRVIDGFSGVVSLSMHRHGCALLRDGGVACLGESAEGQAGEIVSGASTTLAPLQAIDIGGTAIQVAVGRTFSCALRDDQKVLCWGSNTHGQLGRALGPDALAVDALPAVVVGLGDVTQVVTGDEFACALQRSGEVSCWGSNADGQLGIGVPSPEFPYDTDDSPYPEPKAVKW